MSKRLQRTRAGKTGSGKKTPPVLKAVNVAGWIFVGLVVAAAIYATFGPGQATRAGRSRAASSAAPPTTTPAAAAGQPQAGPQPPTRTGQPWEFDRPTNMHWDPRPGHEHWHAGPPPTPEERLKLSLGTP